MTFYPSLPYREKKMAALVNPQNTRRTVSTRGKVLFVLMITVIATISAISTGCGGKTSANTGPKAKKTFWSGEVDVSWYNDEEDEFTINTAEELAGIAKLVNEGGENFRGKTIRLGRDIVISDTAKRQDWVKKPPIHQWTGIGTCPKRFLGTFDGGGHTISGVYIKNPEGDQGLFGVVGVGGTVKNLNVIASYIEGGDYAGILAGGNTGVITECYTSGIVIGDSIVGGLAGVNDGTISNSYAAGSVKGRIYVGGFMGANRGGAVIGNHSSAAVTGDTVVGGFVGANWSGVIGGNFSTGKVVGNGDVGGFAGRGDGGMMRNNYYDSVEAAVSDHPYLGAGKTTAEMQSAELVDSLNVVAGPLLNNIWAYSDGRYPIQSNKAVDEAISIDGYFASGKGTEGNPYIINTKEQLENFSMLVNLGMRFTEKHMKLGQDIMLNDTTNWQNWATEPPAYAWVPIGLFINPFDGIFDGGGHVINGAYIDNPKGNFIGLFGIMNSDATIKNVGVVASYFRGENCIGGLVGWNGSVSWYSGGQIINCYSAATVAGGGFDIGGLAGLNSGGMITESYAAGAVFGDIQVGGLVGVNRDGGRISKSYSTAVVTGGKISVGGLVGANGVGTITECYATGAVSGVERVGGLVGLSVKECNATATISNSYSTGAVRGTEYVGGLVGRNQYSDINACYTIGTVTVDTTGDRSPGFLRPLVGGAHTNSYFNSETAGIKDKLETETGRTTKQMMQKETFAGWDFDEIWGIHSKINNGYPHLLRTLNESEIAIAKQPEPIKGNTDWYDTSACEFTISTAEELAGFAAIVNGTWGGTPARDDFKGKTVKLSQNIDLFMYDNWTPIGKIAHDKYSGAVSESAPFTGTFDGGGYIISNLTINRPESNAQGLFGFIDSATIKNLGLESVNITGGNMVGGMVGLTFAGVVANSYSTGTVIGNDYVGGMAGSFATESRMSNSYSLCAVKGKTSVGGIAGLIVQGSRMDNCYSTGTIIGTHNAGGLAGGIEKDSSSVTNSAALNSLVNSLNEKLGRVAGHIDGNTKLANNAASAAMTITTNDTTWRINKGAANRDGTDLTAAAIRRDGTLGGRFTKKNGWTIENGKLPGLFGKTVEMPSHLTASDKPAPK
jgi:hypothetical protein